MPQGVISQAFLPSKDLSEGRFQTWYYPLTAKYPNYFEIWCQNQSIETKTEPWPMSLGIICTDSSGSPELQTGRSPSKLYLEVPNIENGTFSVQSRCCKNELQFLPYESQQIKVLFVFESNTLVECTDSQRCFIVVIIYNVWLDFKCPCLNRCFFSICKYQ